MQNDRSKLSDLEKWQLLEKYGISDNGHSDEFYQDLKNRENNIMKITRFNNEKWSIFKKTTLWILVLLFPYAPTIYCLKVLNDSAKAKVLSSNINDIVNMLTISFVWIFITTVIQKMV